MAESHEDGAKITEVRIDGVPVDLTPKPCPLELPPCPPPNEPLSLSNFRLQVEQSFGRGYFSGSMLRPPRFVELIEVCPTVDPAKLVRLKTAEPHRVTKQQPDYVHVLTGWRAWDVIHTDAGLRLEALGKNVVWEPKKQLVATCLSEPGISFSRTLRLEHTAPAFNCTCGIWSFKDLDRLVQALNDRGHAKRIKVLGTVSLWGRVVETENGWRAQYGYPSELWLMDRDLEELGLIYDVPVRTI